MGKWFYIYFVGVFFENVLSIARAPLAVFAFWGEWRDADFIACFSTGLFFIAATALLFLARRWAWSGRRLLSR